MSFFLLPIRQELFQKLSTNALLVPKVNVPPHQLKNIIISLIIPAIHPYSNLATASNRHLVSLSMFKTLDIPYSLKTHKSSKQIKAKT